LEVRTTGALRSVPLVGSMVRVPWVPGGTTALAAPSTRNPPPAVTATTRAPDPSRVNNLILLTR
jgi:hypothetical protein